MKKIKTLFKKNFLNFKNNLNIWDYNRMCIKQIKNDIISHLLKYFSIINAFSILCLLLIIFLFQLDNLILAEGVLRPTIKETEVIALFSGYITDVCYKNAQLVEENQLLFSQDCSFEKKLLNNYLIQRELYDKYVISCNEILNLINQTTIYTCNFDKKFMKNNADYASFIKQYKTYKNEMEAKEKYFERQRELYPLIISKQELDNIENDFINSKLSFSNWIENQKIEKLEKYATYIEKLRNIELAIFQVQNEIENSSIRATQSGIINEIKKINIGEYINTDTVILKIFPVDSELKAIIKVLNSNISKIKLGQKFL